MTVSIKCGSHPWGALGHPVERNKPYIEISKYIINKLVQINIIYIYLSYFDK